MLTLFYVPVFLIVHSANKLALLYYGDANSHSVIARSMFDSSKPFSFGTTWLPLYHLLLAPFCMPDILFFNYISGFLLNLVLVCTTLCFLSGILRALKSDERTICFTLSLFALNPDYVYLSLTPMTEVAFIAFMMAAAYYFVEWILFGSISSAAWTSVFIVCCSLIRYEAWFLAPIPVIYTLLRAAKAKTLSRQMRGIVAVNLLAFSGIIVWLLYHAVFYGGAFRFLQSTKSAGYEPASKFLRFNLLGVLSAFSSNFVLMFGPVLGLAVLLFLLFMVFGKRGEGSQTNFVFVFLFLAAPVLYLLVSLFFGYAQIKEHWNSRYLMSAFPLVIIAFSMMFNGIKGKAAIGLFLTGLLYYTLQVAGKFPIVTYADAKTHVYERTVQSRLIGAYIADSLKVGRIGYFGGPTNASHRVMMFAATALNRFDVNRPDDPQFPDSLRYRFEAPWKYYDLIVMENKQAGFGGAEIPSITQKANEVGTHSRLVYRSEYFMVFRK